MNDRLKNLLSPPFIFCLLLLILNDFVLKAAFHNVLTGKLSDFCGLFIFPIFWSAVFPTRKSWVFIMTALLFIFWKSEYAAGFIELANNVFPIRRTVDPTDLVALPVLLLGWFHINAGPHIVISNTLRTRLSGLFIGGITIFSFCATTQQRSVQSFDQPQYVLLQSALMPDSTAYYDEFEFYQKDALLIVKVSQLYIPKPIKDDDYNKNRSLKDLDTSVRQRITDSTSLIPTGKITELTIIRPEGIDSLRFNGGRLDGRFTRWKNNKLIIEGFYKMGIEDSSWTFRDTSGSDVIIKTFVRGERTSVKEFKDDQLVSAISINTRADTIRNRYVQIGVLTLFVIGIIVMLTRNYRKTSPEQLKLKLIWKWLLCFISPIFIWLSYAGIRILLMDFNRDIFETIATIIFIFTVTCPLMFIVVFGIKLRKEIDILLYCLLFGFASSIWATCTTVIALYN